MTTAHALLTLKDLAAHLTKIEGRRALAFEKFLSLFPTHFRSDPLPFFEKVALPAEILNDQVSGDVENEEDLFALLNLAFCEKEEAFTFAPSMRQEKRYELTYPSEKEGVLFSPRLRLHIGPHAHLHFHLLEESVKKSSSFVNAVIEVTLEEGASCSFSHLSGSSEMAKRLLMRVHLAKRSQFHLEVVGEGSSFYRRKYETMLEGDHAEASLSGLFLLSGKSVEKLSSHVYHRAASTRSEQHFRASLFHESRFDCRGSVRMEKEAIYGSARQICRSLLLSENAKATLEPFLEIHADEVKASHGAALGKISEDELFYLRARGIEEKRAKELLTLAFMKELVESFSTSEMKKEAEKMVRKIYGE